MGMHLRVAGPGCQMLEPGRNQPSGFDQPVAAGPPAGPDRLGLQRPQSGVDCAAVSGGHRRGHLIVAEGPHGRPRLGGRETQIEPGHPMPGGDWHAQPLAGERVAGVEQPPEPLPGHQLAVDAERVGGGTEPAGISSPVEVVLVGARRELLHVIVAALPGQLPDRQHGAMASEAQAAGTTIRCRSIRDRVARTVAGVVPSHPAASVTDQPAARVT